MQCGHNWKLFSLADSVTSSELIFGIGRGVFNYTLKILCGVGLGDLRIVSRDYITEMQGAFLRSRDEGKVDRLAAHLLDLETGTQRVCV